VNLPDKPEKNSDEYRSFGLRIWIAVPLNIKQACQDVACLWQHWFHIKLNENRPSPSKTDVTGNKHRFIMRHFRFIWHSCVVRSLSSSSSIHAANAKRKCVGSHILYVLPLLLFLIRPLTKLQQFILFLLRTYFSTLKMEEKGHVETLLSFHQTTWRQSQKTDFLRFPHERSLLCLTQVWGLQWDMWRSAIWKSAFVRREKRICRNTSHFRHTLWGPATCDGSPQDERNKSFAIFSSENFIFIISCIRWHCLHVAGSSKVL